MDLVLCHTTADFDTIGAAVGVTCLRPGSRIVLTAGAHPSVQDFLVLWRDQYPLIERRAVIFDEVRSLTLVDACQRDRFSPVGEWLQQAEQKGLPIDIYDHHHSQEPDSQEPDSQEPDSQNNHPNKIQNRDQSNQQLQHCDFPNATIHLEAVGAATTLVTEALQRQQITPTPAVATIMALGIHSDTGSLTFSQTTPRDAAALAWLMDKGAYQQVIRHYAEPKLSPQLQNLFAVALETTTIEQLPGHQFGWVALETQGFVPGLSGLVERLITVLGLNTLLLYNPYTTPDKTATAQDYQTPKAHQTKAHQTKAHQTKAIVIGRSRPNPLLPRSTIDLSRIFAPFGGGGHSQAASAMLKGEETRIIFEEMLAAVRSQIPHPITAKAIMSSPVRTILPSTSIDEAQHILLRYGHTGLCVIDENAALVGIISRRDIDIALRHGLGHSPVKGFMNIHIKSITPNTAITEIQALMTTHDIGRLPVIANSQLVGIVTRTDLLRQLQPSQHHPYNRNQPDQNREMHHHLPASAALYQALEERIPDIWPALMLIAKTAEQKGWALYLVGGAVRDLLLSLTGEPYPITDIDLVVDGATHENPSSQGAGMALAQVIQATYPQVTVQIHGQFQTASLIWHPADAEHNTKGSIENASQVQTTPTTKSTYHWRGNQPLLMDIATARTEFYPYPAANPEVETSTIHQDLYRRDFTINAMALKLEIGQNINQNSDPPMNPHDGALLDFFGGWSDLQQRHIRVIHPNSFIEDPTRIFRAVRFAVRLGFTIDIQTKHFIEHAINSGVYKRTQASQTKTPALQSRLKAELKYLLNTDQWQTALTQIDSLGAFTCLHPDLTITPDLWRQLRRMSRWRHQLVHRLAFHQPRWLIFLELIIAQLAPPSRYTTAINLDLDSQSVHRLKNLHQWETRLAHQLPNAHKPSQVYAMLHQYQEPELLLMGDRHPRTLGPQIWHYIIQLSQMPALINGDNLKRLGYKPSPLFRSILATVHQHTLDKQLTTTQAAENYVLTHYPLN
ncbi:MAG: CBS domain-containing protein [Phormidesmis sp. RL_2_1]|nr:CBS domain-containing protein [Phormidesmis sp. RL_2_1]